MSKTVEFYFDVVSPASYLAYTQLAQICQATQATLVYRPMLLGAVFQATGNASPAMIKAKRMYMLQDFDRFAKRYGVEMTFSRFFPFNSMPLMRLLTAELDSPERFEPLLKALFEGIWVKQQNLADPKVLAQCLTEAGFDPQEMLEKTTEPAVKEALKAATEQAVARGVFGAPTCFVGAEMFFGQDRLDFIQQALSETDLAQ